MNNRNSKASRRHKPLDGSHQPTNSRLT